jgi:integrase
MTADLLTLFLTHQHQRGLSAKTIRRRRTSLGRWVEHLAPAGPEVATVELVEEFLGRYRSPATRKAYLSDLRAFYRWGVRRGRFQVDPTADVDRVRVPRGLPRPVPPALVPQIVISARSGPLARSVALAAYAGLRRAEVAGLDWADVDAWSDRPTLVVRAGKGGHDRAVPLHPELVRLLRPGGVGPVVGWCAETVGARVADHLRACGLDATCHQLRHSFGTVAAAVSGGDLLVVAELMGHQSPATTMRYTALTAGRTAATVAAMYQPAA